MAASSAAAPIPRFALVGAPNSGKTSLFNALTGLRRKVANYPGVTVEHYEARMPVADRDVLLMDLPGTYSLQPISPDEEVVANVLEGKLGEDARPDAVVAVASGTALRRALPSILEIVATGLPVLLVVTMIDELKARGGKVDVPMLRRRLGIPVVGVVGNRGIGLDDVRAELARVESWGTPKADVPLGRPEENLLERFAWCDQLIEQAVHDPDSGDSVTDQIDRVLLHPVWGLGVFGLAMLVFFQLIFTVAAPLQGLFEGGVAGLGSLIAGALPDGMLQSLLVDGIIAGVGGVVVFVPQIFLLLLLISLLEGCGYMARAAFLVDRVMGWAGLEGRSFVALLSSYACAVPGIMATRSIPDEKTRLSTILVAPFMTCSARLPVYALLIGAFIPATTVGGIFQLQGLVLFGLYVLGSLSAMVAAAFFKRGLKRGQTYLFYMELPPYRVPFAKNVTAQVGRGVKGFLTKAGTIILIASVVLWALLTFPGASDAELAGLDETEVAAADLEASYAASIGKAVEPAIEPLGFDWRIGIGLVASLAAREVIVATLSQVYAFEGGEEDLEGLGAALAADTRPDGTPVYTLATVLSLLVFFVYSLQCVSTLAVIKRETHSWKWPTLAFAYMFATAWLASFVTYQVTSALTG